MIAKPIPINWHRGLSIFASEQFLKAVGDEYGWLGGFNSTGKLRCILPYTIIRKLMIRMVRFRVETIPLCEEFSIEDEKSFLNSTLEYFRSVGADMIIPATTNTIFRTFPDRAVAAPYATYIIDLRMDENSLWNGLSCTYRKNIRKAEKNGVRILNGIKDLKTAYRLIHDTFKRSALSFMSYDDFNRYVSGLGENVSILIADYDGNPQSCTVFPFSEHCAYAVYGGSTQNPITGAMKLVQWEAIQLFRNKGVKTFDLVGGRTNPQKGSKAEGIVTFKQHFGAKIISGYMWKVPITPCKFKVYSLAVRLLRGGDIVDAEHHKLKMSNPFIDRSEGSP